VKASILPSEFQQETWGSPARILRLTGAPCINHATYFLQCPFSSDGRTLIFTSYRSGDAQLFSIDGFPDGPIRQWTDGPAIHPFSAAVHPSGRAVFFVRGGSIWRISPGSLDESLVVSFENAQLGEVSLGEGGEWLTAAAKKGSTHGIVCGRADGSRWQFIPFPRTVIHPQFHPVEPEWIEFAADPAPRMHRVRRDGTSLECLYTHGNDEFVVHETFLGRTGRLVYTVWPHSLWEMDWTTRARRKICEFNAWHITPNRAGSLVLCDTNHPDKGLFLIDAATGGRTAVCATESSNGGSQWKTSRYALPEDFAAARSAAQQSGALSWMEVATDTVYGPQYSHPHPSFSPDERFAIFTSDRTGQPQVYAVELPA
jgi:hypothetical protein